MLTLFAVPKPFIGPFDVIQRNAIGSWLRLRPQPEVILLGDDAGTTEVARELSLRHLPELQRNEYGTPVVSDIFAQAQRTASHMLLCYINADIILLSDFMPMVQQLRVREDRFIVVGRRWDMEIIAPLPLAQPDWEARLRAEMRAAVRNLWGVDYVVFPQGLYRDLPPMALGRGFFDGMLIRRARTLGAQVIDATDVVTAVHQNHNFNRRPGWHSQGEALEIWRNYTLAGGSRLWFLFDATHRLTPRGLKRLWGQKARHRLAAWLREWLVFRTGVPRRRLGLRRASLERVTRWLAGRSDGR